MNKFFNYIIILLIAFCFSCKSTGNKEFDLIGSWRIESIEVNQKMKSDEKANFDLYIAQLKETSYFTYKADHSYEYSFNDEKSAGRWALINKGSMLINAPENSEPDTFSIEELTGSTCKLIIKSDEVITRLLLKKQK
jgi:hypothetical protein